LRGGRYVGNGELREGVSHLKGNPWK